MASRQYAYQLRHKAKGLMYNLSKPTCCDGHSLPDTPWK